MAPRNNPGYDWPSSLKGGTSQGEGVRPNASEVGGGDLPTKEEGRQRIEGSRMSWRGGGRWTGPDSYKEEEESREEEDDRRSCNRTVPFLISWHWRWVYMFTHALHKWVDDNVFHFINRAKYLPLVERLNLYLILYCPACCARALFRNHVLIKLIDPKLWRKNS
jgi:hypothetical protein